MFGSKVFNAKYRTLLTYIQREYCMELIAVVIDLDLTNVDFWKFEALDIELFIGIL